MQNLPEQLDAPLSRLKTRCVWLAALRGVGIGAAIFLGGAIVTGWTDLIVPLPASVRLMLVLALLAAALLYVIFIVNGVRLRSTASRLAGALDRVGGTGGQIRAGVELAERNSSEAGDPLTADLTRRAIQLSSQLAAQQDCAAAQPAAPAFRPYAVVLGVLLFLGGAWIAWPNLVTAQAARVLDPTGQHRRHSPYTFHVKPSAPAIVFGDPFEVSVSVGGADARERFEWIVEQPGRTPWRFPLLARPDGTYFGNLSAVVSDFKFYIEGIHGQSERYATGVINTPLIKEAGVRIVYPAYTGLPPVEGPLSEGGPAGVRGTQVTLFLASNRPLAGGRIECRPALDPSSLNPPSPPLSKGGSAPAVVVEMKPQNSADPKIVAGTFEITGDLKFSATLRDVAGLETRAPLQGRCLMVPDHAPRVSIVEPRARSFATPDIVLPLIVETEDDFGISEILLYRSLNGSRPMPMPVALNDLKGAAHRSGRVEVRLPLSNWALDPGDVLELHVLARDNDPAGAKTAETPVHRVSIITREQYLELLRQQETIDDLSERYTPWLRKLVELRRQWQFAQKDKDPKKIAEVREALREAVEQLEEQLKEPPVFSADLQLSKELRELQETLRQAMKDIEGGNYDEADNRLGMAEEDAKKDLEFPLEMLTKLYRLIEDESLFTVLAQVQEDLSKRLERYAAEKEVANAQDARDLKALLDEQLQIQSSLQRTLQDIRDHAGQLPRDNPKLKKLIDTANEFTTKVHDAGIDGEMEKAVAAMSARRGTESHEHAKKAAELMMALVEKIEGGGGMAGQAADELRPFGPHIFGTVNQLLGGRGLPGLGQGRGKGGGYSMGRGSNSPALYGNKKQRVQKGGGAGGGKKPGSVVSGQGLEDVAGFGMREQFDSGAASTVPLSAIPSRYRSAVRDFNRRIAEESADNSKFKMQNAK